MPQNDNHQPLSIRRSIVVWVAGAVLGWVIAVITIYGAMRMTGDQKVAAGPEEEPPAVADDVDALQKISPAAGGDSGDDATDSAEDNGSMKPEYPGSEAPSAP